MLPDTGLHTTLGKNNHAFNPPGGQSMGFPIKGVSSGFGKELAPQMAFRH
jgi:hypothetical protein